MTDQSSADRRPITARAALLALMTAALWGGNPVAVSYSVDSMPPILVAAVRFAMASLFMYGWCRAQDNALRLRSGEALPCLIAGFGLFVQIGLFNVGVWLSNSSHASMLINTFVFWVVAIEHFVTKSDRLTARKFAGLMLASAGVLLVLCTESRPLAQTTVDTPTLLGDIILLVSAFTLGLKIVYVKGALKIVEPGKLVFWHNLVGMSLFFVWSLATENVSSTTLDTPAILALLYQGMFVGGLCFAVHALLLRHHSASKIAIFSFATPLFGVVLGVMLRGDAMTPWLFVAAGCVAIGILLVNLADRGAKVEGTPKN